MRGSVRFEFAPYAIVIGRHGESHAQAITEFPQQLKVVQNEGAACMNHNAFRVAFQYDFQAAPGQTVLAFDVLIRISGGSDENSATPNLGARLA